MKQLIVNADDFGFSPEINQGIVEAFLKGIVTSTTLVANGKAFHDACQLAVQYALPTGIHFNLTDGKPLLPPDRIPSLVNDKGEFLGKKLFLRRSMAGKISKYQIEDELFTQIERMALHGIMPDHFDSHHHIHTWPFVSPVFKKIAWSTGIVKMRYISYPFLHQQKLYPFLQNTATAMSNQFSRYSCFNRTDYFAGFCMYQASNKLEALFDILIYLPKGLTELMVHPGYVSRNNVGYYNNQRVQELKALCSSDVQNYIRRHKIRLCSF